MTHTPAHEPEVAVSSPTGFREARFVREPCPPCHVLLALSAGGNVGLLVLLVLIVTGLLGGI